MENVDDKPTRKIKMVFDRFQMELKVSEYKILTLIASKIHSGGFNFSHKQIAQRFNISTKTVTRSLDRLVVMGYLVRTSVDNRHIENYTINYKKTKVIEYSDPINIGNEYD